MEPILPNPPVQRWSILITLENFDARVPFPADRGARNRLKTNPPHDLPDHLRPNSPPTTPPISPPGPPLLR
jgi:hypothetical protein